MKSFQTQTSFISIINLFLSCFLSKARSIDGESNSVINSDFSNATKWNLAGALFPTHYPRERVRIMEHEDRPVPENFDARTQWPGCTSIGEIWHQGSCGSCWAIATAMMMADRTCIVSNQTKAVYFSAEDLLSCCSYCVPESKSDICKTGGIAFYALQYWIEKGVVSGGELGSGRGCKPYKMSTYKGMSSPCQHSCTNQDYSVSYSKDKHFGGSISEFEYPTNVKHLQIEIMTNGPVVSFIKATPEFETNYRNEVYEQPYTSILRGTWHSVRIIGWGEDSGVPYWLVANTWGKDWGNLGGFFKILRGQNHLGIEKSVLAGHLDETSSSIPVKVSKGAIVYICVLSLLRLNF